MTPAYAIAEVKMRQRIQEADELADWVEAFNERIELADVDLSYTTAIGHCERFGKRLVEQRIVVDVSDCDMVPRDFYGVKRWSDGIFQGEVKWNAIQSFEESFEVAAPVRKYFAVYYVVEGE